MRVAFPAVDSVQMKYLLLAGAALLVLPCPHGQAQEQASPFSCPVAPRQRAASDLFPAAPTGRFVKKAPIPPAAPLADPAPADPAPVAPGTQVAVTGQVTDTARNPVPDAVVEASNPDTGGFGPSTLTDKNGCYTLYLDTDKWLLTIWKLGFQQRTLNLTVASTALNDTTAITDVNLNYGRSAGEFYRMILGLQQSGASSSGSARKLFADLYLDIPAKPLTGYDLGYGPRWRFWADLRITSVPESAPVQLSQFDPAYNIGSQLSKLDTSQLAQSVAFSFGPEFSNFGHPPTPPPTQQSPEDAPYAGLNAAQRQRQRESGYGPEIHRKSVCPRRRGQHF